MGPGYFPLALSGLLVIFGLVAVVRSFFVPGEAVGAFAWKPLGAHPRRDGPLRRPGRHSRVWSSALLALVLTSAAASEKFRFDWRAALGLVALIVFCSLVFVKGLGVPMPLFGPWLEPLLGSGIAG